MYTPSISFRRQGEILPDLVNAQIGCWTIIFFLMDSYIVNYEVFKRTAIIFAVYDLWKMFAYEAMFWYFDTNRS
jgi:hypothetical protein